MKKGVIAGLAVAATLLAGAGQARATAMQWQASNGGNDHWYEVVDNHTFTDWAMANAQATAMGGHLATLASAAENDFVYHGLDLFDKGAQGFYLGGYQLPGAAEPTGGWAWVTGEVWAFANWSAGEPNNSGLDGAAQNYLHYYPAADVDDSGWDDIEERHDYMYGFILEREAAPVPEPGTMVLLGTGLLSLRGWRRKRACLPV